MDAKTTSERTVIAALPGWYVARYVQGGEARGEKWEEYFGLSPIVAWEIEREESSYVDSDGERFVWHQVTPLTLEGNQGCMGNVWCIKTPDGLFDFVEDCTFSIEQEALQHARERDERRAAKEQAKPAVALGGSC